ncbi:MAG: DUF3891 family protein [Planctomycetales bacterium]|nr:DUF3891 family protein [Planctomycetales bacterium]MBN8628614.1 DUF3891 family protein [Planctomycetota bacterium]
MIRRDITLEDGRPGWALVSQVEHARIAMEMARAWSDAVFALPERREEFIAAVYHHDDGWIAWELRPTVGDGKPRDFLEMPIDEALAIWRRSIAVARNDGPLAGYAVSTHFATLCGRSAEEKSHDPTWKYLAEEFLEEQADHASDWRRDLVAQGMPPPTVDVQTTLAWQSLRLFDLLSLWLCCAERREPDVVGIGEFAEFQMTPQADEGGAAVIRVDPWPLVGRSLELAVACRTIPAGDYPTDAALSEVLQGDACRDARLTWRLVP